MSTEQQTLGESTTKKYECPKCSYESETERGIKIHYGKSHEGSIAKEPVECTWCGDTTRKFSCDIEKDEHHFCNTEKCQAMWLSENSVGENNPNYNSVTVECEYCGGDIDRPPSLLEQTDRYFCRDKNCCGKWRSENVVGENHPRWNDSDRLVECTQCSEEINREPYIIEKQDSFFCLDKDCRVEWLSENSVGENNPAWNGGGDGLYSIVRNNYNNISWGLISERHLNENPTCQLCGCDDGDKNLHLHHIIPVLSGGTNCEYNRMTLCIECHQTVESYTKSFMDPIIRNVVSESKSTSNY